MNRFWIRAVTYGLVIVLGLGAALPSLLPPAWLSALPAAYQSHSLTLGLDLQGGSHLLLKVDTDDLTRGKSGREKAEIRDDAVARSLEVVRRRLNETGVVEPLIVRQGDDGIVVQLPGVTDPERIKTLLGRTAKLSFHLLAEPGTPARRLPASEGDRVYPLKPLPLLDGGNLEDARLGFEPRTGQPVVSAGDGPASGQDEPDDEPDDEIVSQIKELLDTRVRPAVAMDGGDITFESYRDGVVYLSMMGACSGCPSSQMTLKMGIETRLRQELPEVQEVVPV